MPNSSVFIFLMLIYRMTCKSSKNFFAKKSLNVTNVKLDSTEGNFLQQNYENLLKKKHPTRLFGTWESLRTALGLTPSQNPMFFLNSLYFISKAIWQKKCNMYSAWTGVPVMRRLLFLFIFLLFLLTWVKRN